VNLWVQTSSGAAALNGIFVEDYYYTNPTVAVGDKVTLTAKYVEHGTGASGLGTNTGSELILFPDRPMDPPASSGAPIAPVTVTLDTLKGSSGKNYDGVLVQLQDPFVRVSNLNPDLPQDYNEYLVSSSSGSATVRIGALAYGSRSGLLLNDKLSTVRGLFHKVAGIWNIEPRDANDIAKMQ
jgi:hypothetical protein